MANYTILFSDILKQIYINNKYTFKEQIEKQYSKDLYLELCDPFKIIKSVRTKFFNFQYELYDAEHKKELETKILCYFYDFEIGAETYQKFKFDFIRTFYETLPYYNQLYKAVDKEFDFDVNVDIVENLSGSGSNKATNETSNTLTSKDTDTQNIEYEERLRKSDTPQNMLDNVENGKYISEYNYNNNESSTTKENELNSSNNASSLSEGTTQNQSLRTLKGTNTRGSKSKMLKEYIEIIQNVDMKFIEELKSCFFVLIE